MANYKRIFEDNKTKFYFCVDQKGKVITKNIKWQPPVISTQPTLPPPTCLNGVQTTFVPQTSTTLPLRTVTSLPSLAPTKKPSLGPVAAVQTTSSSQAPTKSPVITETPTMSPVRSNFTTTTNSPTRICRIRNTILHEGQKMKKGPCVTCVCTNGKFKCDREKCPRVFCYNAIRLSGSCCYVCPTYGLF